MPVVDNTDSLNQIMPHLDTVANVAYLNVSVSNMIRTLEWTTVRHCHQKEEVQKEEVQKEEVQKEEVQKSCRGSE
jgi:hypothetical protein